jgi:hypothetical protein
LASLILATPIVAQTFPVGPVKQNSSSATPAGTVVPRPSAPQPDNDPVSSVEEIMASEPLSEQDEPTATGIVFIDNNSDGKYDSGDAAFGGVRVSNGIDIVTTDDSGRYRLPVVDDSVLFVIKPYGYQSKLNDNNLPQFYYVHKPEGSPELSYPGTKPTGPLPESVDFALYKSEEAEDFKVLLFGDPQPRNHEEVDYVTHDVIKDLIGSKEHAFGVTLGDIAFDKLETFETLNQAIALIGVPWHNVIGNHDLNLDATKREHINETFEATYGPSYYSFDYGQVHFLVLDTIGWTNATKRVPKMHYTPVLGQQQLKFIKRDLSLVPDSQMVVLLMHVPIISLADKADLFRLIEKRPYCISISGHTHDHRHLFLDEKDGFKGSKPHHHIVNVTVSGSWWSGAKNENGIPHSTMADGAPNGYSVMTFDDSGYRLDFRAAGRPADDQLRIEMPSSLKASEADETVIWVNVYNGSAQSKVRIRVDGAEPWIDLEKTEAVDPYYKRLKKRDQEAQRPLARAVKSTHLWRGNLPKLKLGVHVVTAETVDRHGRKYSAERSVRVTTDNK